MPASKIQNKQEVIDWFEEGRTYEWMAATYRSKYGIETGPSMWANFRSRNNLVRRTVRDDELIPWEVKEEHRWANPLAMLRAAARQRAGIKLTKSDEKRLAGWLREREKAKEVVHYDPDTDEGFWYVPRRPGIDLDLIREPEKKTTKRRNADPADE
ncbi:hypothetical protein OG474_29970 [Kribbella sp. NBC_01505]|uniref:hypothetical protein n=1 Tax=Kribbella sp. NBC_01505 TaxID=2903580 RepID=UPI0038636687